tara:strand:+ start:894 stop:1367 length:474 start_codon:yes stop_codon:yes gene_type:complete
LKYIYKLLLIILLTKNLFCFDYSYEGNFESEFIKIETPDNKKYNILINRGAWRDSFGDIGTAFCHGKVETLITGKFNLEVVCENKNEKNEKFWILFFRERGDQGGGVGKARFLNGTGKYIHLIGQDCTFVARYFNKVNFHKHKCKIDDEKYKKIVNQ